ncbi:GLPGLI family protein [Hymenobacter sp. BT175]|uniref:GLPGLI family protein n=1 Tax=Hymenobacter translucens TaxID=2886507 RepID=UPI001D0F47A0|nr:GLPGLI family protein [Hymenobacter translucens]MCC2546478.1 GLPGLI family protein [Hymenobacter translucens]
MKKALLLLAATATAATATAQTSGHIQYEVTQKVDPNARRVIINGQEVKPGSPDFPADIPDTRSFAMTLTFAGPYAKEERQGNAMRMVMSNGPGTAPQVTNLGRPFEEAVYVNQAERAFSTVLTVKKDGATSTYQAAVPFAPAAGWQDTDQTKKIAGYTCRKATVPFKKETYTVWYTTELPFTYSPVKELLPAKGVVLALEGSGEQFRAGKVDAKPVKESEVRPAQSAQTVTADQLQDVRQKALADFRQKMLEGPEGGLR